MLQYFMLDDLELLKGMTGGDHSAMNATGENVALNPNSAMFSL